MKNLIATFVLIIAFSFVSAQLRTPSPSPSIKMEQQVGLETITLDYSRPGVKGRKIFGELVPYGKIWRTGANQATKISFSSDVTFNGKEVKKGTYAMYTIPGKDEWTIMLNEDLTIGGNVARYSEDTEAHRSTVKPATMDVKTESFLILFDELRDASAKLYLMWDNVIVEVPMEFNTDKQVMSAIDRTMAGPSAGDYYQAAVYYYNNDKDLAKANEWITKASDMNPNAYWVATWKARILAKQGKKKEAMAAAEAAMKKAEKAGNKDYVKINSEIIKGLK